MLPRLKYHNPRIDMSVTRSSDQAGPATLLIYLRNAAEAVINSTSQQSTASTKAELLPSETFPSEPNRIDKLLLSTIKAIPKPADGQEIVTIEMKHENEEAILQKFLAVTGGQEILPTQGELDTLKELEVFREKAKADSAKEKTIRDAWKKEQDMLKRARGELNDK